MRNLSIEGKCYTCKFYDECEYSDGYNFCEDCKNADVCPIRYSSQTCKAGYEIECNNGFEIKSIFDEEESYE